MKEHVSQVYLNEHALLLFSCTVWRQTDRARPKAVALALLGEVHFLCLLCGAARRRLSYAKRAITEWLERTCSFIIFVHGLATDRPCAAEGRGTGVEYLCGVPRFIFAY